MLRVMMSTVCLLWFSTIAMADLFIPQYVPDGLSPGDTYHLAFTTSTVIDAYSSDIAVYNAHVQAAADAAGIGVGSLFGDIQWKAIVSTGAISAFDNTNVQGAVYGIDGRLIAVDAADLWDSTIANDLHGLNEYGQYQNLSMWTGSGTSGVPPSASEALGASTPIFGGGGTSYGWISFGHRDPSFEHALYAISQPFTVEAATVPEPSTFALLVVGGIGLVGYGLRGKRKQR